MEQVGLDDVEFFTLQETDKGHDLARQPEQIRRGREIEIAGMHRDARGSQTIDETAFVAVKDCRDLVAVPVAQLA